MPVVNIQDRHKKIYKLKILFYIQPSKVKLEFLKRNKTIKLMYCNKHPDLDNYLKYYIDILKGVIWKNDNNIVSIYSEKYYTVDRERIEFDIGVLQ